MASIRNSVNLDAMIARADFAIKEKSERQYKQKEDLSVKDLREDFGVWNLLRKPDFQRETNHWSPEQVVSLLKSFLNGDLIPSVIFWGSPSYIFVIDGGHRLSVLKAWVEDDFGDRFISKKYFGDDIPKEQIKSAEKVRRLMKEEKILPFHELDKLQKMGVEQLSEEQIQVISTLNFRSINIQWVTGSAEKAEVSFFNINTKGTPLDDIEESLLITRRKPISIAARAIIRAGGGHKYWSKFGEEVSFNIVETAKKIHNLLFTPDIDTPVKTLDLPLGGSKGVRTALQILIEFLIISEKSRNLEVSKPDDQKDDADGSLTLSVLKNALYLIQRMTGNDQGSLGLHPAVYFYGPTGRHSSSMFMGTCSLISRKIYDNNSKFFRDFTEVRRDLESILVKKKDLFATILQKFISRQRNQKYHHLLEKLIDELKNGSSLSDSKIVSLAGLEGKVVTGSATEDSVRFSDDQKSKIFIYNALKKHMKCTICHGYLDPAKSISYDHIKRVSEGGKGSYDNGQLTHPYCNQSIKN